MTDALDEISKMENVMNCKKLLEEVTEGEPEHLVVFTSKDDKLPSVFYCTTPAIATMLIELGKFSLMADMIHGEDEVEE